ncbi:TetR/AcrR family transcriptional regulator [Nocardia vaccinii]|uniref:TetR/AcrR family transcriptional regulator n=1 Tax=Nocardia vaccinii TaxID=1822 RepID=UPI000835CAAC|nr:TetR/AcrR family transcriptional regulator [Nocardia vaccinii]
MTRPGASLSSLFGRAVERAATAETNDDADAHIFDAALTVLAERGTRLATMDDVATASGVSRATLFRRFGGKDALFETALAHELRRFLDSIANTFLVVTDPTERIAEAFVACVQLRARALRRRSSPDYGWELLAILEQGDPALLEIGRRFIAAHIVAGQAEGVLPQGNSDMQAEAIIRLTLGYLLAGNPRFDIDQPDVAREVARRTIAPLVTGVL